MASRHKCPPWCHRCQLMPNKGIMPACHGTANSPSDLKNCTCTRRSKKQLVEPLADRIKVLEAQFQTLQDRFQAHLLRESKPNTIEIFRKEPA